jgi:hypothetical protein
MLCVYSKDNPSNHVADLIPQEYRHSGYIAFIQGRSQNDGSGWTTDAEITIVAMITETYIALQSPIGGTTTNSCAFVCFAPWDETPTNTKHVEQNANFSKNAEIWGHIGANNSSNFH